MGDSFIRDFSKRVVEHALRMERQDVRDAMNRGLLRETLRVSRLRYSDIMGYTYLYVLLCACHSVMGVLGVVEQVFIVLLSLCKTTFERPLNMVIFTICLGYLISLAQEGVA